MSQQFSFRWHWTFTNVKPAVNCIKYVIAVRSFQGLVSASYIYFSGTNSGNVLDAGENTFPFSTCTFVDVRDVAYAHIQAFEDPSACGRYCLVERAVPFSEVQKILYGLYPSLHLNEK